MSFCLHFSPYAEPEPARSRPVDWRKFVPCTALLLRLVEGHLASVQRLHGILAKPPNQPHDPVCHLRAIEDPGSALVLGYGIDAGALAQTSIETEEPLEALPALYLVASSPMVESCAAASPLPPLPPLPPRLTPLAVSVLRRRLAQPVTSGPVTPRRLIVVHDHHTFAHILPSLSNGE